ncbi:hypothetical protein [Bradyrhizobium arachidis]|uniref:hypothetical protein n=1 Tax=Bradyrhizobium arachidis TaxID=858423 RepID=UPI0021629718|nr:hypothetical protein [Bradyrhizobium arachidis]UVO28156.1 hypothetical protein KUF59_37750 [Bradyrhizobium arachidis]
MRWPALGIACLLLSGWSSVAISQQPKRSGNLVALVDSMLNLPAGPSIRTSTFLLRQGSVQLSLRVETFYSTDTSIDERVNRCVANPAKRTITCDLRFVDNVASDLNIMDRSQSQATVNEVRRRLLKWIVAHEVGHIALKHVTSDYADPLSGYLVFVPAQQRLELAADAYALRLIGNLKRGDPKDYAMLLGIVNALIRQKLCPETFPIPCNRLAPGVGIIFNSGDGDNEPIRITAGGAHPEFVARFLRLVYLAGQETNENTIDHLAKQVIDKLLVEVPGKGWLKLDAAFEPQG